MKSQIQFVFFLINVFVDEFRELHPRPEPLKKSLHRERGSGVSSCLEPDLLLDLLGGVVPLQVVGKCWCTFADLAQSPWSEDRPVGGGVDVSMFETPEDHIVFFEFVAVRGVGRVRVGAGFVSHGEW